MKREFLQGIRVGDAGMPEEVIDAILEENGRDVAAVRAEAEGLQGRVSQLEKDLLQKDQDHQAALAEMAFRQRLDTAITAAGGRSAKAIAALLDLDVLRESKQPETDIAAALTALKQDCDYLFQPELPPPYAAGTGTGRAMPGQTDLYRAAAGLTRAATGGA